MNTNVLSELRSSIQTKRRLRGQDELLVEAEKENPETFPVRQI